MSDLVRITLPDGSQRRSARGTRVVDFVREGIGAGLAKAAYFAKLDGEAVDLCRPLDRDVRLEVVTTRSPEALEVARHDAAHVMASVVQRLYPGTQVTIGPAIEDGLLLRLRPRDSPSPRRTSSASRRPSTRRSPPTIPSSARRSRWTRRSRLFEEQGRELQGRDRARTSPPRGAKTLTLYRHGDWVDFCLGPHGPSTGRIGVVKLTQRGRRLLARRSEEPHAAAHLRHRVLRQEGARGAPHAAWRRRRSATTASWARRWASSPSTRTRPAPPSGCRNGTALYQRCSATPCAGWPEEQRLRRDQDAAALQQEALGDQRPLGQVPREHVPRRSTARPTRACRSRSGCSSRSSR